jgi:hypothetical protein
MGPRGVKSVKPAMVADLVVAHGEPLAEFHVRVGNRFIVQVPENQSLLIVAGFHEHPHPLACTKLFVLDLDLNVVAFCILSHVAPIDQARVFRRTASP